MFKSEDESLVCKLVRCGKTILDMHVVNLYLKKYAIISACVAGGISRASGLF